MKYLLSGIAALVAIAVFSSCKRTVTGEGPFIARSFPVTEFQGVSLNIQADVTLVIADSFNCIVTAQNNVLDVIQTDIDGSVLELSSKYKLDTPEPVTMVISMPSIKKLQVNGAGSVKFLNTAKGEELRFYVNGSGAIAGKAEVEELRSEINGTGEITLSGSSRFHKCTVNGTGDIHAYGLETDESEITINGSGDAEVSATSKLEANIRGTGTVTYKGQPHLVTEIMGSGEIKKAN